MSKHIYGWMIDNTDNKYIVPALRCKFIDLYFSSPQAFAEVAGEDFASKQTLVELWVPDNFPDNDLDYIPRDY